MLYHLDDMLLFGPTHLSLFNGSLCKQNQYYYSIWYLYSKGPSKGIKAYANETYLPILANNLIQSLGYSRSFLINNNAKLDHAATIEIDDPGIILRAIEKELTSIKHICFGNVF